MSEEPIFLDTVIRDEESFGRLAKLERVLWAAKYHSWHIVDVDGNHVHCLLCDAIKEVERRG
jgi:hypothetical protein